jgi:hypothetical protein
MMHFAAVSAAEPLQGCGYEKCAERIATIAMNYGDMPMARRPYRKATEI